MVVAHRQELLSSCLSVQVHAFRYVTLFSEQVSAVPRAVCAPSGGEYFLHQFLPVSVSHPASQSCVADSKSILVALTARAFHMLAGLWNVAQISEESLSRRVCSACSGHRRYCVLFEAHLVILPVLAFCNTASLQVPRLAAWLESS